MLHSESLDKIGGALAKAQGAIHNPDKNREVTVTSKRTGGQYTFSYATLDNIFDALRKPLSDNGLSFTQTLYTNGDGKLRLVTLLLHESGQWIKTETPVKVQEDGGMQELGSAQTYARRYAISSLLGIAAEEDDDANAADGNTVTNKTDRARPNGTGRTAAPRQPDNPMKAEADRIKENINLSEKPAEIDALIAKESKTLAEIKKTSQTAYEWLMKFAEDRKSNMLRQAA